MRNINILGFFGEGEAREIDYVYRRFACSSSPTVVLPQVTPAAHLIGDMCMHPVVQERNSFGVHKGQDKER